MQRNTNNKEKSLLIKIKELRRFTKTIINVWRRICIGMPRSYVRLAKEENTVKY